MSLANLRSNAGIALAVILLAALALAFFHHHAHGDHSHDCAVCRFVQFMVFLFVPLLAALIAAPRIQKFLPVLSESLVLLFFAFDLEGRAPPSLS